jgi:hypothetical protein
MKADRHINQEEVEDSKVKSKSNINSKNPSVKKKLANREHKKAATRNANGNYIEGSPVVPLESTRLATNRSWVETKMRPRRRARRVNQQEYSYQEEKAEIELDIKDSDDDSYMRPGAVAVPGPPSVYMNRNRRPPRPSNTRQHPEPSLQEASVLTDTHLVEAEIAPDVEQAIALAVQEDRERQRTVLEEERNRQRGGGVGDHHKHKNLNFFDAS